MYLHVGNQKNIRKKYIIGIFDMDTSTVSGITRQYLADAEKRARTESAGEELPKSFVLYIDAKGNRRICFSQLSASALGGRLSGKEKYEDSGL